MANTEILPDIYADTSWGKILPINENQVMGDPFNDKPPHHVLLG